MDAIRPLRGIRVIDFTSMMSGPFATRILVDCGADVIKVEPLTGDYMRYRSPIRGGRSSYYGQMNGGKKSIAVDLKTEAGRDVARRLVADADVVVENFRPGVMAGLGLGYADLKEAHPRLVYCSITGFGQTGKRARDPAYAPIIHAASGYDMAHMKYNADLDRPATTGVFMADVISAIYAFGAIQTALLHRERFGQGQHVDVTLIDSMLNMLIYELQEAQFQSGQKRPLYQPLKAADGFVIVAPVNQKNFEKLAHVMGRPRLLDDERFSQITAREQHWGELMAVIEEWTSARPAADCEALMMAAGVPCSRYNTVADLFADAELHAQGSFTEVSDGSGRFSVPNQPFRFSGTSVAAAPDVSDIGQDTDDILAGHLKLSPEEIVALRRSRAVA